MSLRSAVIGAGTVSNSHLTGLSSNPKTDLVAICDLDETRSREKARDFEIKAYFEVDEMLAEETLDWVHICTPPQTHSEVATAVMRHGVPVLIEKPVTVTVEDFEEIARVSSEQDVAFSVVHNHKFDPVIRRLREQLDAHPANTIRGTDLLYTGSSTPDLANRGPWNFDLLGGEFEEGLAHPLYIELSIGGFPRDEASVSAQTTLAGNYDRAFGYDGVHLQYVTDENRLCSSTILSGTIPVRILYVHGTERSYAADLISQTLVAFDRDYKSSPVARARNNVDQSMDRLRGTIGLMGTFISTRIRDDWQSMRELNSSFYQYDLEAEAILTRGEPAVSVDEARWTVVLQEAIRNSVPPERRESETRSATTTAHRNE